MAGCMVLLTILNYLWQENEAKGANIGAMVFLFGFATFSAIGWQGTAGLYQVEVVPLRIRGPANALNNDVASIPPIAFYNIGYRTNIIFAVTNAGVIPFIYFLYQETVYRSLEEVDVLFYLASQTPNPWLSVVKIAREEPLWVGRKATSLLTTKRPSCHQRHVQFWMVGLSLQLRTRIISSPSLNTLPAPTRQAISTPSDNNPSQSGSEKKLVREKKGRQTKDILGDKKKRNRSWNGAESGTLEYSEPEWWSSAVAPKLLSAIKTDERISEDGGSGAGVAAASWDY
ncbi:hypothetical protein K469DRAFT_749878 [Zopfia rhizophila CBS 207.26]|uniref:Major facilitator superfamily (MFS) profile domain-containing protein n=1 Tax=Zopfia rhizophila CBS 207.26 TaxID=1314779 RepID=A0A6A6E7W8_9PEZI|nr:hypothetical protein K469DRAFT_749878 [Zopfia rhizophila CBS 207.26]